jgi:hypothetical protein
LAEVATGGVELHVRPEEVGEKVSRVNLMRERRKVREERCGLASPKARDDEVPSNPSEASQHLNPPDRLHA